MTRTAFAILITCCLVLPACTKSRNNAPEGKSGAPKLGAPPAPPPGAGAPPPAAPTAKPSATAKAQPKAQPAPGGDDPTGANTVPDHDGEAMEKSLGVIKAIKAMHGPEISGEPVKAILAALNTKQNLRGNRGMCVFSYAFVLINAAGKPVAQVGICGPEAPKANHGGVFVDLKKKKEWAITIPDCPALVKLLEKRLPTAKNPPEMQ